MYVEQRRYFKNNIRIFVNKISDLKNPNIFELLRGNLLSVWFDLSCTLLTIYY